MKKPFMLSLWDHEYLQAVLDHCDLTGEQITKLLYKSGSLTYVRAE